MGENDFLRDVRNITKKIKIVSFFLLFFSLSSKIHIVYVKIRERNKPDEKNNYNINYIS